MTYGRSYWVRVLYRACATNRKRGLYCVVLACAVLACKTVTPLLGKQIFDVALPREDLRLVLMLGSIWIGILWAAVILTNRYNVWLTRIDAETLRSLRAMVLRAMLLKLWTEGNTNVKSGEQLSRVLTDTHMFVNNSGIRSILEGSVSWLSFLAATTVSVCLDWPLALLCVTGASLSLLLQYRLPRRLQERHQEISALRARTTNVIENILMAWRVIIRHRKIEHEVSLAQQEFKRLSDSEISAQNKQYSAGLRIELFSNTLPVALIWLGAYRMLRGSMSLGTLIAFSSYLWFINNSLSTGFWKIVGIVTGIGQAKEFLKILAETSVVELLPAPAAASCPLENILLENMVIRAGAFKLEGERIELSRGATYLLIGDSGVGKSTFLEFLAGLRKPERVRIQRNGQEYPIDDFTLEARSFGYIGKDETLLDRSVSDNISYASSDACSAPIRRYTEVLRIQDLVSRSTAGLSAGERQRISLIRELSRRPEVFLVDEGLDSLDNSMKVEALKLIREVLPDSICVICTHNWRNYATCVHGVMRIANGQIYQEAACGESEGGNTDAAISHNEGSSGRFS